MTMKAKFMQALLGLVCLSSLSAQAAGTDDASVDLLVLKMADASTKEFKLSEEPIISFADGKLVVTAQTVTTDYEQSDVTEFYFKKQDPSTGIDAQVANLFSFTYNDNAHVVIAGSKAQTVALYTVDGKLVKSQKVVDGAVTVDLTACSAGIYVLNLENEHTFKIIKK